MERLNGAGGSERKREKMGKKRAGRAREMRTGPGHRQSEWERRTWAAGKGRRRGDGFADVPRSWRREAGLIGGEQESEALFLIRTSSRCADRHTIWSCADMRDAFGSCQDLSVCEKMKYFLRINRWKEYNLVRMKPNFVTLLQRGMGLRIFQVQLALKVVHWKCRP